MTRYPVTKQISQLFCVAALLCLVDALSGELAPGSDPVRGATGDPAPPARDSSAIAEQLSKLTPMRMKP